MPLQRKLGIASVAIAVVSLVVSSVLPVLGAAAGIWGLALREPDHTRLSLWLNIVGLSLNMLMIGAFAGIVLLSMLR
jgi:hypothetical protein